MKFNILVFIFIRHIFVDADLGEFAALHTFLEFILLTGDFALDVAVGYRFQHAAVVVDLGHLLYNQIFHLLGDALNEIGARQRVDGVS